jgi:hypothetical protein
VADDAAMPGFRLGAVLAAPAVLVTAAPAAAAPPHVVIDAPAAIMSGASAYFNAIASSDPDGGTLVAWSWDLNGDGAFGDASEREVFDHPYPTPGDYLIRLQVTDDQGETGTAEHRLQVTNRTPTAEFISIRTELGLPMTFDGSPSSDPEGRIVKWEWDWEADGVYDLVSSRPKVTKVFRSGAEQRVRLRVTDEHGGTAEKTETVATPSDQFTDGHRGIVPEVRMYFRVRRGVTRAERLLVSLVPEGGRVTVRCKGPGCPRRIAVPAPVDGIVDVAAAMRGVRLRSGARLTLRITRPGRAPHTFRWRVRRKLQPKLLR